MVARQYYACWLVLRPVPQPDREVGEVRRWRADAQVQCRHL